MSVRVGTPYRCGGRGPDGYDCWGLVLAELPHLPLDQYRAADRKRFERCKAQEIATDRWVSVWPPCPGDVVLMGTLERLRHAGVAVSAGIKHTTPGTGVLIQSLAALRQVYSRMEAWRWVA